MKHSVCSKLRQYWTQTSFWRKLLRLIQIFVLLISGIILSLILTLSSVDFWMSYQAQGRIYQDVESTPTRDIAVILGTSKYIGRTRNPYYTYRIDAAIELYKQHKVRGFLLSGDNAHRSYNEPWTMKRDLLAAGIPEELIFLDYAGFRTLDSIVRAKQIFNLDDFTIVTQTFHCDRALFIANYYQADATCLGVPSPTPRSWFNVRLREVFARIKAMLDLYIMNTQPKFLGPQQPILQMLPVYDYGPIMPRFIPNNLQNQHHEPK